ncbi:MAG: class I SAM-dependent methyltransferase [Anaerococcus hydrogenalis]|uniref:tRNA (adenine(22)-N(1))-methyltransferase n=1 Tax=Anaerococcus hydrogenalis TaxID=33029 RepID=UPI0028FF5021|nr:class I SAM-dependent methyltransferase [Anaerococcus hydrogenalis]MDU2583259.1 class I SAM-dependent methyltransferase [Anaerococcus hydrogenalis]
MKITKRLENIANLVEKGKSVIDIGTDHGLVPLYLAKNNISKDIIATDISAKSLKKLEDKLDKNLENIIKTEVCDGLDGIDIKENQIAIIAGMGAITIIDILSKDIDKVRKLEYVICEGNIGNEKLRKFLNENNFIIDKDFLIKDGRKHYDIIRFKNGSDRKLSLGEIYFGKFIYSENNPLLMKRIEQIYNKNLIFKENIEKYSKDKEGLDLINERLEAIREVKNYENKRSN